MIKVIGSGEYSLFEPEGDKALLQLDSEKFIWDKSGNVIQATGDLATFGDKPKTGNYRHYEVKNEPRLTETEHLELIVGEGKWQGFLLPAGLLGGQKKARIIPTSELISTSGTPSQAVTRSIS